MKTIATALLLLILTIVPSFCDHPSLNGIPATPEEIYANLFDLEGQIIRIQFPSLNPKQISKEQFSLDYGTGRQRAIVLLPAEVAKKYFTPKTVPVLPRNLYVRVQIGEITNEYGAKEQGPILQGLGTMLQRGIGGDTSFKW